MTEQENKKFVRKDFTVPAKIILFFFLLSGIGFLGGIIYKVFIAQAAIAQTQIIKENRPKMQDIEASLKQLKEKESQIYQDEITKLEKEKAKIEEVIQEALTTEPFAISLLVEASSTSSIAYISLFILGIAFLIMGPYNIKRDKWFMVSFFIFYLWAIFEIPTIIMDMQFIQKFDPAIPVTDSMREIAYAGHQALGVYPLINQFPYFIIILLSVFKPGAYKEDEEE